MTKHEPFPPHLAELFPAGPTTGRTLAVPIPAGRTVLPDEGDGPTPVMWMSDGPAPAGLWSELHAAHRFSGLWPLLLADLHHDSEEFRPWGSGELFPAGKSRPRDHDPQAFLTAAWTWAGAEADLASYIRSQGGPPTARAIRVADADASAAGYAEFLLRKHPRMRIGLVPSERGADTLTTALTA
ncbi:hypothetical protein AB0D08_34530 [Kitasatospora sp. NPDC048540]|uniref:hypothetical protein n=1 Tax=Kitasatospora sp. NPDC048540 TaxID=3155634 RepID=UPI0033EA382A